MPSGAQRYLLDTNALVALMRGHADLLATAESADWLGVSVINVLEFLGFDGLSESDRQLFNELLQRIAVVDLSCGNAALICRPKASSSDDHSRWMRQPAQTTPPVQTRS